MSVHLDNETLPLEGTPWIYQANEAVERWGKGMPQTPRIGRRHDNEGLLMIEIRREEPTDRDAVYSLNVAAFDDSSEAKVVDQLRNSCADYLAFVAVQDDIAVGHILFTPATVDGCAAAGMGLAPMAVKPSHQRRGIGSQLVRHGLEHFLVVAMAPGHDHDVCTVVNRVGQDRLVHRAGHALGGIRGIGPVRVVGGDQTRDVDEKLGWRLLACQFMTTHECLPW